MGSSLILQGGAAVAKTLKESVTQAGHGFTVGDVIRWDGALVPPKYVKAIADTAQNAEVAGVVSSTPDPNEFEVTYHGYIDLPSLAGISAPVMFLSGSAGGSLAASPPSAVGTVVKPVLTKNSNGSGYLVMNYLGTQIGGSSTIAVDEIQPVGTIMPYAGTSIPDTWLACDGNSYAMSAYPELYENLCFASGNRAPMYGHIVDIAPSSGTIATTEWTASAVGDYIYIKNRTTTAGGGTPDVNTEASYDFLGRIIAKGTLPSNPAAQGWTVRILGKYSSSTKRFEMPNAFVLSESGTGFASSVRIYSSVASGPRGSGGSINTASIVAFNTPNLRGRFLFGEVGSGEIIPDADPDTLSTFAYDYPMASWGGEERHSLTIAEMPAHDHPRADSRDYYWLGNESLHAKDFTFTSGTNPPYELSTNRNIQSQGGNAAHNNMPPYMAVRYIIKAKPYTRAAIIDGVDIPYTRLLVSDLRSGLLRGGGVGEDLVFKTNTSLSTTGTEQMRLTNDGKLVVGYSSAVTSPNPLLVFGPQFSANYPVNAVLMDTDNPAVGKGGGIAFAGKPSTASDPASSSGRALFASIGGYKENSTDGDYAGYLSLNTRASLGTSSVERVRITSTGDVGIRTTTPGATLDVNGTLKVGDFGGATNVMPKAARVSSNGVGHVVPLFTWSTTFGTNYETMLQTTPLPGGKWFVNFTTSVDSGTTESENPHGVMAHVWDVPASKWLTFATVGNAASNVATSSTGSGVFWKIHDSLGTLRTTSLTPTDITIANGWTEFVRATSGGGDAGGNCYSLGNQNSEDASKYGFVYNNKWVKPVHISGYAMRIA